MDFLEELGAFNQCIRLIMCHMYIILLVKENSGGSQIDHHNQVVHLKNPVETINHNNQVCLPSHRLELVRVVRNAGLPIHLEFGDAPKLGSTVGQLAADDKR